VPPSAASFEVTDLKLADHHRPVLETVRRLPSVDSALKLMLGRSETVLLQFAAATGSDWVSHGDLKVV
jgi:hypothetical protein